MGNLVQLSKHTNCTQTNDSMNLIGMGPTVHSISMYLLPLYSRTTWLPQSPNFCRTSCTWGPCTNNF